MAYLAWLVLAASIVSFSKHLWIFLIKLMQTKRIKGDANPPPFVHWKFSLEPLIFQPWNTITALHFIYTITWDDSVTRLFGVAACFIRRRRSHCHSESLFKRNIVIFICNQIWEFGWKGAWGGVMVRPCKGRCVGYLLQISDTWIWEPHTKDSLTDFKSTVSPICMHCIKYLNMSHRQQFHKPVCNKSIGIFVANKWHMNMRATDNSFTILTNVFVYHAFSQHMNLDIS